MDMVQTSLCYLERDGQYLMLHRVKKEVDANRDKWIGIGGKFEDRESPEDCALREVQEETGLTMTDYRYRGIVTFVSDRWPTEYMHLFTCTGWTGTVNQDCDEGELVLFPQAGVCRRNLDPGRAQREIHSMMKRECRKLRRSRCATWIIAESKK